MSAHEELSVAGYSVDSYRSEELRVEEQFSRQGFETAICTAQEMAHFPVAEHH